MSMMRIVASSALALLFAAAAPGKVAHFPFTMPAGFNGTTQNDFATWAEFERQCFGFIRTAVGKPDAATLPALSEAIESFCKHRGEACESWSAKLVSAVDAKLNHRGMPYASWCAEIFKSQTGVDPMIHQVDPHRFPAHATTTTTTTTVTTTTTTTTAATARTVPTTTTSSTAHKMKLSVSRGERFNIGGKTSAPGKVVQFPFTMPASFKGTTYNDFATWTKFEPYCFSFIHSAVGMPDAAKLSALPEVIGSLCKHRDEACGSWTAKLVSAVEAKLNHRSTPYSSWCAELFKSQTGVDPTIDVDFHRRPLHATTTATTTTTVPTATTSSTHRTKLSLSRGQRFQIGEEKSRLDGMLIAGKAQTLAREKDNKLADAENLFGDALAAAAKLGDKRR